MRRLLIAVLVAVLAAGGAVAAVALFRSPQAAPTSGSPAGAVEAGVQRPGWNSAGGSFAAQPVVPPSAVPGRATGGSAGEAARPAGPADYVGFVPTRLRLPSGRTAPVQAAGVRADGTLAVPDDPARLGRWTGGALPGERYGAVVLAGHVDSARYGVGVLAELRRAEVGDVVRLGGAGRVQAYVVTGVRQVPKTRLATDSAVFGQTGDQRLVLVTCGGPFDRATRSYADNVVVTARPV